MLLSSLFFALSDGKGFLEAALDRMSSNEERKRMLRMVNPSGVTMFGRAIGVDQDDDEREINELLQFFLDEVMLTDEDAVYHLTTPAVVTMKNPLVTLVNRTASIGLFEKFMNRLSPSQRIEQLIFRSVCLLVKLCCSICSYVGWNAHSMAITAF